MIFYNMIDYEYFDSVDDTEENKKHTYTINDYSDTIEKSHITINETSTNITTLNMIIFIILAMILIIILVVYCVKSKKKNVKND